MFKFRTKKRNNRFRYKPKFVKKNSGLRSVWGKSNNTNISILLSFFVLLFSYFFLFSDILLISEIRVEGNRNISQDDIKNIANIELSKKLMGIIPENNYIFNQDDKIKSALFNKFSEIKSIDIKKGNNKTLLINITEKESNIIWCRSDDCYYIDGNATAFSNANEQLLTDEKPLKIIEQLTIEEELADDISVSELKNNDIMAASEIEANDSDKAVVNEKENIALAPIRIGDKLSDEDFIDFAIKLSREIASKTSLNIKFFKTKGTKTREIIAFTDKNVRLYFNTTGSPASQVSYLSEFLTNGVEKGRENELRYIYLESENKIYYRF
ncbi:MAG: FtsQ-type POTRA domain-containing protein [Minisyncoccia bacterium]